MYRNVRPGVCLVLWFVFILKFFLLMSVFQVLLPVFGWSHLFVITCRHPNAFHRCLVPQCIQTLPHCVFLAGLSLSSCVQAFKQVFWVPVDFDQFPCRVCLSLAWSLSSLLARFWELAFELNPPASTFCLLLFGPFAWFVTVRIPKACNWGNLGTLNILKGFCVLVCLSVWPSNELPTGPGCTLPPPYHR